MSSVKAQVFSPDFIVASVMFILILVILHVHTQDVYEKIEKQENMIYYENLVSTTDLLLLYHGYPPYWNETNIEVLGLADSFGLAFFKAEEAAQQVLPAEGTVLITVSEKDRPAVLEVARRFYKLGFKIKATKGTNKFLAQHGIDSELILKMHEGRPNIVDGIMNYEIQLVINTPSGKLSKHDDSYIRKSAIKYRIPYITTLSAALAAARGIERNRLGHGVVKSLQSYHVDIKY